MYKLKDYGAGRTVSTGLVIARDSNGTKQFLLASYGREARFPDNRLRVPVFGIGGRPEPAERLTDCVIREACEEAGIVVDLMDSEQTVHLHADEQTWLTLPDSERPRPCFLWADNILSFAKDQQAAVVPYLGVVFRGVITGTVPAQGDTAFQIWVPGHLLSAAEISELTVHRIVEAGGEVLGRMPPRGVSLALVGTARWIGRWLSSTELA